MSLLIEQGWSAYYTCNCSGGKRSFYHNDKYRGYEVRVNEKKQTFSLLLHNHIIVGPEWLYKLKTKLKENGILEEQE